MSASCWYTEYNDISEWDELLEIRAAHCSAWTHWYFRGQQDASWKLTPSLERIAIERFGREWSEIRNIEQELLREFKRYAHLYIPDLPKSGYKLVPYPDGAQEGSEDSTKDVYEATDDDIEWLALMQHHGAPTRLLDWTYSFSVALLFAIGSAAPGTSCAVWGMNHSWCWERTKALLPPDVVKAILADPQQLKPPEVWNRILYANVTGVAALNPFRLNERAAIQRGVFVAPLDLQQSFTANLRDMDTAERVRANVFKITVNCSYDLLHTAIRELDSDNINWRTLFPGLDGFCRSLENRIRPPDAGLFALAGRGPRRASLGESPAQS